LAQACDVPEVLTIFHPDLSQSETNSYALVALVPICSASLHAARRSPGMLTSTASWALGPYTITRITPPNQELAAEKMSRVELQIESQIADGDSTELTSLLSYYLDLAREKITVLRIIAGSVWVEIELPASSAKELYFRVGTELMRRCAGGTPDTRIGYGQPTYRGHRALTQSETGPNTMFHLLRAPRWAGACQTGEMISRPRVLHPA
jgi:hypothetical protein